MWKIITAAVLVASIAVGSVAAQVYVKPYTRKDGTTVQGHYRSSPNSTTADNYSTRGNVNPYTGKPGTRDPDPQPSYSSGYSSSYSSTYRAPSNNTTSGNYPSSQNTQPYSGQTGTQSPYQQPSYGTGYSGSYGSTYQSPYSTSVSPSTKKPK
ncbi:hypothetical protein MCERH10_02338 [Caulobacteraceae bacterium]